MMNRAPYPVTPTVHVWTVHEIAPIFNELASDLQVRAFTLSCMLMFALGHAFIFFVASGYEQTRASLYETIVAMHVAQIVSLAMLHVPFGVYILVGTCVHILCMKMHAFMQIHTRVHAHDRRVCGN